MGNIEELFPAEKIFTELEAENPTIKELLSRAEQLEIAIQKVCGDVMEEYTDLQTRLQYEISRYSFMQGVKVGFKLKNL